MVQADFPLAALTTILSPWAAHMQNLECPLNLSYSRSNKQSNKFCTGHREWRHSGALSVGLISLDPSVYHLLKGQILGVPLNPQVPCSEFLDLPGSKSPETADSSWMHSILLPTRLELFLQRSSGNGTCPYQ
jgi:hypothetical protein